jgi:hypothetical protein
MMKRKHDASSYVIPLLLILVVVEYFPAILEDEDESTKKRRCIRAVYPRSSFNDFLQDHTLLDPIVSNLLRMELHSFNRLVLLLENDLKFDESYAARRGGEISPQYCLFMTLRYLAGARYQDISKMCKVSPAAVYDAVEKTMVAIVNCPQLAIVFPKTVEECQKVAEGFASISTKLAITTCVGAIDGFLMPIKVPSKKEVGNVSTYYSGHYARYGLNVQAICDSYCRFTFLSASAPGSVNDGVAYEHCKVGDIVECLPYDYVVIADAAYAPSEHCLPMYYGTSRKNPIYDNYNFYASQLRIRIEMAFGMMTRKWLILDSPVKTKLPKTIVMIHCISRLHNYCINERLIRDGTIDSQTDDRNCRPSVPLDIDGDPIAMCEDPHTYRSHGHSVSREIIATGLARRGLVRPLLPINVTTVERVGAVERVVL